MDDYFNRCVKVPRACVPLLIILVTHNRRAQARACVSLLIFSGVVRVPVRTPVPVMGSPRGGREGLIRIFVFEEFQTKGRVSKGFG